MIFLKDETILEKILYEIKSMGSDITELKTDVSELKNDVSGLKTDVSGLKYDITDIKIKQREDHQILKALEHKAEHDKMLIDIAKMQGYEKNISENIDAIKEIIGRHEVDIAVLKKRPV